MKRLLLSSCLLVVAVFSLEIQAFDFVALNPNLPIILSSDAMPDDYYALIRLAGLVSRNRGNNLMVIAVDGETDEKARAFHNLLYFFGADQAQVVSGNPNVLDINDPLRVEYPTSYDTPQLRALFNSLAASNEPAPWVKVDYRLAIKRFVSTRNNIQLVFIGNPLSFADVQDELDPLRFKFSYRNALYKKRDDGKLILAFNGNRNVQGTDDHMKWCIRKGIPTLDLPSELLAEFGEHDAGVAQVREALLQSHEHDSVLGDLAKSLGRYTSTIQHTLVQRHGALAPFIYTFDPRKKGWFQDAIFLEAILNGGLLKLAYGVASVDLQTKDPQGLGFFVNRSSELGGQHLYVTGLELPSLARQMAEGLRGVQVVPTFNPTRALSNRTPRPLVQILKGSNDDEGALMGGLALGDTALVITESSRSLEIANRYERTLAGYQIDGIPVIAGKGHTWEQMAAPSTALSLELKIAKAGGLSVGLLEDQERAAINELDPSTLSAAQDLAQFLTSHDNVVIQDTASGHTLVTVLRQKPELALKIHEYHMMGGFRKKPDMPEVEFRDGAKGFRNGEITRCWKNQKEVEELLGILQKYNVPVYVASSHHSGGNSDDNTMPLYSQALAKREEIHPMAQIQRNLRIAWNAPLAGKIPVETSLGPPLGYLQLARIALGREVADGLFGATRGRFIFKEGGLVVFVADETSNVHMLDLFERFPALDETFAHLSQLFDERLERRKKANSSCPGIIADSK